MPRAALPIALACAAVLAPCPTSGQTPAASQEAAAVRILSETRAAIGSGLSEMKTLVITGRTRQVRGDNLVPIEFEIQAELPDKFARRDEFPAQDAGPTVTGFNGEPLRAEPGAATAAGPARRSAAAGAAATRSRGAPAAHDRQAGVRPADARAVRVVVLQLSALVHTRRSGRSAARKGRGDRRERRRATSPHGCSSTARPICRSCSVGRHHGRRHEAAVQAPARCRPARRPHHRPPPHQGAVPRRRYQPTAPDRRVRVVHPCRRRSRTGSISRSIGSSPDCSCRRACGARWPARPRRKRRSIGSGSTRASIPGVSSPAVRGQRGQPHGFEICPMRARRSGRVPPRRGDAGRRAAGGRASRAAGHAADHRRGSERRRHRQRHRHRDGGRGGDQGADPRAGADQRAGRGERGRPAAGPLHGERRVPRLRDARAARGAGAGRRQQAGDDAADRRRAGRGDRRARQAGVGGGSPVHVRHGADPRAARGALRRSRHAPAAAAGHGRTRRRDQGGQLRGRRAAAEGA